MEAKPRRTLLSNLVELGLCLVLLEGLLRRLAPELNMVLMGVKFIYFPTLYALFFPDLKRGIRRCPLGFGLISWLTWGLLISLIKAPSSPMVHLLGIVINLLFVPLIWIGASAYPTVLEVRVLMYRLALLSAGIGAFGIYQTFLPASHPLNMAMDFTTNALSAGSGWYRITSTLPHCNLFGSFVSIGMISALASIRLGKGWRSNAVGISGLVLIYGGGIFSGSRMATVCALLVMGAWFVRDIGLLLKILFAGMAGLCVVASICAVDPSLMESIAPDASMRAFDTEELTGRTTDMYFGSNFGNGADASEDGLGVGWGVYTMGVASYAERLGLESAHDGRMVESGFSIIVAHLGVFGIFFFGLMHVGLLLTSIRRGGWRGALVAALAVWSFLAHLPLSMFEIPTLCIPFWLLLGVGLNDENRFPAAQAKPQLRLMPKRTLPSVGTSWKVA